MAEISPREQQLLDKLTEIVIANLSNDQFTVSELAREVGLSHPTLHRKLKIISNQSVSQFIREVRLKKAMELLQSQAGTVAEIAYEVGFGSSTYFSKCFHEFYGYPPGEAGNRMVSDQVSGDKQPHLANTTLGKSRLVSLLLISTTVVIFLSAILYFTLKSVPGQKDGPGISIAVLPFRNDSPDSVNTYFMNGLMEAIVTNLANIEGLDVRSRTSSEEYRDMNKSIRDIAKELEVDYLVEASGQKYGDEVLLNIQLIRADKDRHLLSEQYKKEINSVRDLVDLQLIIARDVASKIEASITPEAEAQIATLPTENLAAYNLYLQGQAHLTMAGYLERSYDNTESNKERMKARLLFKQAVVLDSTFSEAYAELAKFYFGYLINMNMENSHLFHDSGLVFINKALQYDPENQDARLLKYDYYLWKGMTKEAQELESVFSELAKDHEYYRIRYVYYNRVYDYKNAIQSFYSYLKLKPADQLTPRYMYSSVIYNLQMAGFTDLADTIICKRLEQDSDSIDYFRSLLLNEMTAGNYPAALEYGLNAYRLDTTISETTKLLMFVYLHLKDYSNAFIFLNKSEYLGRNSESAGGPTALKAYTYLKNDMKEEAEALFQEEIRNINQAIKQKHPWAQNYGAQWVLAVTYSFMGNREATLEYLSMLKNSENINYGIISDLKFLHVFDYIRDDPKFNKVFKDLETSYLKMHNRVKEMLIQEDVLEY